MKSMNLEKQMKRANQFLAWCILLVGVALSSGCLVISDGETTEECWDECYDYEVCETYCDPWGCWDECWYETVCDTYCEDVYVEEEVVVEEKFDGECECYSDIDCEGSDVCVANECKPLNTEDNGLSGLCQSCETNHDCVEDGAICTKLNFDQATSTGEKVCTRPCEYNHECPAGFECINISSEVGVAAQCLPVLTDFGKRTCNPSPELECVRATDCGLGESCVNNSCQGPTSAECDSNNACSAGLTCRNFKCVDANEPECATASHCASGQICVDGSCEASAETCVFNDECDGGACVDGQCASSCNADADCGANEFCRSGLCEAFECRRSADCAAGSICVNAECEQTCNPENGAGCDDGYVCNDNGYCDEDPNVECRTTAECARDEICVGGACSTACTCNQQCGDGQVCDVNSGVCQNPTAAPTQCGEDCDCPSGESCVQGQCQ